jgi:hypothetical protein
LRNASGISHPLGGLFLVGPVTSGDPAIFLLQASLQSEKLPCKLPLAVFTLCGLVLVSQEKLYSIVMKMNENLEFVFIPIEQEALGLDDEVNTWPTGSGDVLGLLERVYGTLKELRENKLSPDADYLDRSHKAFLFGTLYKIDDALAPYVEEAVAEEADRDLIELNKEA